MSAQVDNMLKALSHASGLFISTGYVVGQSSEMMPFWARHFVIGLNKGYTKS